MQSHERALPRSVLVKHQGAQPEPLKIKLTKGQKDSYGWEISCAGSDLADVLMKIRAADAALRSEYNSA